MSFAQPECQGTIRSCPYCGHELVHPSELDENISRGTIWRRHRRTHYEWCERDVDLEDDPYLSKNHGPDHDDLDRECQIDTQQYEITFHDEHVETVNVEASDKHQAKEIAEHERTYNGEFTHTLHTEKREVGDPSQASVDYLERMGLLSDDHDVTPSDLERMIEEETEERQE